MYKGRKSEKAFIEQGGYEGWIPEYGTKCRGPVPPSSKLTDVDDLVRQRFKDLGHDPGFYLYVWNFVNMMWFTAKGWTEQHGLDCTHSSQNYNCVHAYFLMAMIDDFYDYRGEGGRKIVT